jgi:hypothetical protein
MLTRGRLRGDQQWDSEAHCKYSTMNMYSKAHEKHCQNMRLSHSCLVDFAPVPASAHIAAVRGHRYPPQGTVLPNMEDVQLFERIKTVKEDPEYQPPQVLARPSPFEPPRPEHLLKPQQFVMPGAFD